MMKDMEHRSKLKVLSSRRREGKVKRQRRKVFQTSEPLLYVLMWGANLSRSEIRRLIIPELLLPDDFKSCLKVKVENHNFNIMPPVYKYKDYCPIVFKALRKKFMINEAIYWSSLIDEVPIIDDFGGRSKAKFFHSTNKRIIFKTITSDDVQTFLMMLPDYYNYIVEREGNTLLAQYLGLCRITIDNDKPLYIVASKNVFSRFVRMKKCFDIKGSTISRTASDRERKKEQPVYKDNDFVNASENIYIDEIEKKKLLMKLKNDVEFLSRLKLMDYSLLVGICDMNFMGNSQKFKQQQQSSSPMTSSKSTPTSTTSNTLSGNRSQEIRNQNENNSENGNDDGDDIRKQIFHVYDDEIDEYDDEYYDEEEDEDFFSNDDDDYELGDKKTDNDILYRHLRPSTKSSIDDSEYLSSALSNNADDVSKIITTSSISTVGTVVDDHSTTQNVKRMSLTRSASKYNRRRRTGSRMDELDSSGNYHSHSHFYYRYRHCYQQLNDEQKHVYDDTENRINSIFNLSSSVHERSKSFRRHPVPTTVDVHDRTSTNLSSSAPHGTATVIANPPTNANQLEKQLTKEFHEKLKQILLDERSSSIVGLVHGKQRPISINVDGTLSSDHELETDGKLKVIPLIRFIYYLGIIDIFTRYGMRKKTANAAKSVKYGGQNDRISTISPDQYAKRLYDFIESHICTDVS
ncbi:hypothetical protein SNEBB_002477 [Seison nebaliae]|nr:hypothetical protein SNEBB_002477 [Seison nebaliae]